MSRDDSIGICCPHCGKRIKVPSRYDGHQINCPACQSPFVSPGDSAVVVPPPLPPPSLQFSPEPKVRQRRKRFDVRWVLLIVILVVAGGTYALWESEDEMAFRIESGKYLQTLKRTANAWPGSPHAFSDGFDENDKRFHRLQAIVDHNARLKLQARMLVEIQNLFASGKVYFALTKGQHREIDDSITASELGKEMANLDLFKRANNEVEEAFKLMPEAEVYLEDHRRFTISRFFFP